MNTLRVEASKARDETIKIYPIFHPSLARVSVRAVRVRPWAWHQLSIIDALKPFESFNKGCELWA